MCKVKKCVISGLSIVAIVCVVLIVKARQPNKGRYENVGKLVDKKMKKLMWVLEKTTAHVQSVFEQIKRIKP
jgi:hypothetical protein